MKAATSSGSIPLESEVKKHQEDTSCITRLICRSRVQVQHDDKERHCQDYAGEASHEHASPGVDLVM